MNPEMPQKPQDELEASLTALLLGELPHDQAAALHQKLAQDAELSALYERLKLTIALVRETFATPAAQTTAPLLPLRLEEGRRQKLLQHFKTVAPKEFAPPPRRSMRWLIPVGIAAAFVVILGGLFLPALSRSKGGGPSLAFSTWSLSESAESAAPSEPSKAATKYLFDSREHSRREQLASETGNRRRSPVIPASTVEVARPAKSAGAAIVLPKAGQPDVADTTATVLYSSQPEPAAAANVRAYFDDSSGRLGANNNLVGYMDNMHSKQGNVGLADGSVQGFTRSRLQEALKNSDDSGTAAGAGGAATFGGFGATTRGRAAAAAEDKLAKGVVMDDFYSHREARGLRESAAVGDLTSPTTELRERYATPSAASSRRAPARPAPQVTSSPAAPAAPPVARSLGEGQISVTSGEELPPALATVPVRSAPAGGIEVAKAPLQTRVEDRAGGDLFAGTKVHAAGSQPAEVAVNAQSLKQVDLAWSDAGKKPADASVVENRLSAGLDGKAKKEASKEVPVFGYAAAGQPASQEQLFGLAVTPSQPAKGGELAGRHRGTLEFNDLSKEETSRDYRWDTDAIRQQGVANADGEKPPVLGDLPAAGHYFRLQGGAGGGGAAATPEVAYSLVPAQVQEGVALNYGVVGQRLAERGVPADTEKNNAWYAKSTSKEGAPSAISGGRPQNELSAGALRLKVEEKVKSVELADKLDTVASGIETLGRSERQHAESEGKSVHSLDWVGNSNLHRPARDLARIAPTETTPTPRFDIALPAAEGETSLGLKDSSGVTKKVPQLIAANREMERLARRPQAPKPEQADVAPAKPAAPAPVPQPEVQTGDNAFSTFSLNVSDVSFKLAAASLEKGVMPEPATGRSEEFINAFDYRDAEPPPGVPVAFAWERARYPFAQNRDVLRFSIKTAALGRQPGRALNIVLLLDNSGSMERADRVRIIREALRVLAGQLQPQDKLSVVAFARTPRLFADGAPGTDAKAVAQALSELTPQGGTNLEDAMDLAYQTARRHYLANGINRVVVLTDGAANLGNVEPEALKQKVEANRKQGIALDCFGIGWEGYNDDLLEVLSRNGDGRYGFINTPEEAATEFAGQLAGALKVAASDVKVQVEFNPARVTAYRQIGYAKHQLTKEQFRDNTVDAAEIGAAESGNALYVVEVNPRGRGALATVRVRYKVPGTTDYREQEWPVPYTGNAEALEQASPALRLAATASAFSEWLVSSPYAAEITPDRLLGYLSGVPEVYGADARPKKLEWMLRQAKSIAGK